MENSDSIDHLPPLKGGRLEEGSLDRSTLKSSQSMRQKAQTDKKLEEITEKLNAIRLQRSALKKYDDGRVYGPKTDYSTVPKKLFSHPHLEYVYGEIMYSPYLTNPKDRYPKAVYTMSDTLKSLKSKGVNFKDLPETEKPYDETQLKRAFIREVCNYNPKFNVPKMKKGDTGSLATGSFTRGSTADSSVLGRANTASSVSSSMSKRGAKEPRTVASIDSPSKASSVKKPGSPTLGKNSSSSRSSRSKKLDSVKPRRHASASSMSKSLDASNFSQNNSQSFDLSAIAKSAPTESMRYEKDTFTEPEDEEYKDDFADPPMPEKEISASKGAEEEDPYELDFEATVVIVAQDNDPTAATGSDNYNEDFEPEIVKSEGPSPLPSAKVDHSKDSGYADDFNVPEEENEAVPEIHGEENIVQAVSGSISSSIDESEVANKNIRSSASATVTSHKEMLNSAPERENDAYADDFDIPAADEVTAPLVVSLSADTHDNNVSSKHSYTNDDNTDANTNFSAKLSAKVDPDSVKLRTDLIPGVSNSNNTSNTNNNANNGDPTSTSTAHLEVTPSGHMPLHHENTGHSVLSDQSNASIKEEYDHTSTFSPPMPSTVRSEISVSNNLVNSSQQNSYSHSINSFHNEIVEDLTGNNEVNAEHEVYAEVNTSKDGPTAGNKGERDGIASVVDEAIDDTVETIEDTIVEPVMATVPEKGAISTIDTPVIDTSIDTLQDTSHNDSTPTTQPTQLRDSPLEFPESERLIDSPYSPIPTEHIDLIPYTEISNTSVKENVTVENNFLHSPVKSVISAKSEIGSDAVGDGGEKVENERAEEDDEVVKEPVNGESEAEPELHNPVRAAVEDDAEAIES